MKTIRYDISTVADRDDLPRHNAVRAAGYKVVDHPKKCREDADYLSLCQQIMTAEVMAKALRAVR